MTLALEVGASSEELFQAPSLEIAPQVEEEVAPEVASEPLTEKVQRLAKGLQKEACSVCGAMIAQRQMANHVATKHRDMPPEASVVKPKETKAKVEKTTTRRVKADEILTTAIVGIAGLLVNSGMSAPTGQALMLEATLLGPEFDKAAAGTVIDKWALQPIVKAKGRWQGVAGLAAFPTIVFALDRKPELLPVLYPALRSSMKTILPGLVQAKKRQIADETKLREAAQELMELDAELAGMAENAGPDPIDMLIQSLFASKAAAAAEPDGAPSE